MTRTLNNSATSLAAQGIDRWTDQQRLELLACYDVWSATPARSCDIAVGDACSHALGTPRGQSPISL